MRINLEGTGYAPIAIARTFVSWLGDFGDALLWITEFGIWKSREDLNVYYRFRASYGDLRQIHETPGHSFLSHERNDLASFLSLAIQFGWGGHLVPAPLLTYVFLSHDGWALVSSELFHKQILTDLNERSIGYELVEGISGTIGH